MKSIKTHFMEFDQADQTPLVRDDLALFQYCDLFSTIATESFYILDVEQKHCCNIKSDSFICSFFAEDALIQGYDLYSKIVYPADLCVWSDMFHAILRYIRCSDAQWNEIDHFSCTFRLQRRYSFHPRPLPHMVFHRMKHVLEDDKLRYLICSVGSSTAKKTGNLRAYNKDGLTYKEYNYKVRRWQQKAIETLTEREKAILVLAQQGKTTNEIADDLYKGFNTIRNQIKALFSKLNVHSMQEAIEYASNHCLIYPKQHLKQQSIEEHRKRSRTLLTEDMLQRIQQYLDDGKSIRQAARLEGVTESAIRYWKEKGKLELCKQT